MCTAVLLLILYIFNLGFKLNFMHDIDNFNFKPDKLKLRFRENALILNMRMR